jgi:hypothetical protein
VPQDYQQVDWDSHYQDQSEEQGDLPLPRCAEEDAIEGAKELAAHGQHNYESDDYGNDRPY